MAGEAEGEGEGGEGEGEENEEAEYEYAVDIDDSSFPVSGGRDYVVGGETVAKLSDIYC